MPPGTDTIRVPFYVWMYPGDNCRISASTYIARPPEVTWLMVDTGSGLPSHAKRSAMLTVWRKLHIDQDSMNAPGFGEGELNYIEGDNATYDPFVPSPPRTDVHLGLQLPGEFRYESQFQNGEYEVIGANSYPVRNSHLDDPEDWIVVTGDPCGDGPLPPCSYKLRDDDNDLLVPSYPDLGTFALEFHKAYIDVDFLIQARDRVAFDRNMPKSVIGENGAWNAEHTFFNSDAVYNRQGEEVESLKVDESVFGGSVRYPLLKQAIVMYQANKRVGTAANKSRGMVVGSGKKLFRQKGTGGIPLDTAGGHARGLLFVVFFYGPGPIFKVVAEGDGY